MQRIIRLFSKNLIMLAAYALMVSLLACTAGSGPGGAINGNPEIRSLTQGSAADGGGILSAPIDDDLMGDYRCLLPWLLYGEGFSKSYKEHDFASWHIPSGNTFSGKFMLIGMAEVAYKDIQVRVVHSNASGTERRYRDFSFAEVPATGSIFEVTIEKVGYGDRVEFFIVPRQKVMDPKDPEAIDCIPGSLKNYSETWKPAGDEDFEKSLGLLASFKIFLELSDVKVLDRGIGPEFDFAH